jgi:uncharacterized protein YhaN
MKLVSLLLFAFGPFTRRRLDFGPSGTGLHLIVGPNEAGKSSALRAIGDLRFGIPERSEDDFVHGKTELQVGAIFLDGNGQAHGYARRKKRDKAGESPKSLGRVDPLGGDVVWDVPFSALELKALHGGFSREEHDQMFAMDHAALRNGGDALIQGRGDLGSALFQASAGAASVPTVLAALDDEARRYFAPRASTASINAARVRYDTARKAASAATVRGADWDQRRKRLAAAEADCQAQQQALETARTHARDLTQLVSVGEYLRTLDDCARQLRDTLDAPLLTEDAATRRTAAVVELQHAQRDQADARTKWQLAQVEYAGLPSPDAVLALETEIARFAAAAADAGALRAELALVRSDPGVMDNDLVVGAAVGQGGARDQMLQTLEAARTHAAAWGDADTQAVMVEREADLLTQRVNQQLNDLGVPDVAGLIRVEPVLPALLDDQEHLDQEQTRYRQGLMDRQQTLTDDLRQNEQRLQAICATGDIVTLASLSLAREQRNDQWQQLRRHLLDPNDRSPVAGSSTAELLGAFEVSMTRADDQADRLHDDADRAAQFRDVQARLQTLKLDLAGLERQIAESSRSGQDRQTQWIGDLARRGLPALPVRALRQWQEQRERTLEDWRQVGQLRQRSVTLQRGRDGARRQLIDAMTAVLACWPACPVLGVTDDDQTLADLQRRAADLVQAMVTAQTMAASRAATLAEKNDQQRRRQVSLDDLIMRGRRLIQALGGDPRDVDESCLELTGADLAHRLTEARRIGARRHELQTTQTEQQQRLELTNQRVAQATQILTDLCAAAQVETVDQLPQAEARSDRRRAALQTAKIAREQLARVTGQSEDQVRARMQSIDPETLPALAQAAAVDVQAHENALVPTLQAANLARTAFEQLDDSDAVAVAREAMELASASYADALLPWARLRLAQALLRQAADRYAERAQAPMLTQAQMYFSGITAGRYPRLVIDGEGDHPVLLAVRDDGSRIRLDGMSEGTRDQLYLALRLAALGLQRESGCDMPLILDDVLMTSDDERATHILQALMRFAEQSQVLVFTHHDHLADLALRRVGLSPDHLHRL